MPDRHAMMTPPPPIAPPAAGGNGTPTLLPPLVEGERMDQPTFHARYQAMPPGIKAELIDGVAYMPSPLRIPHGRAHVLAVSWLVSYQEDTPGVDILDNATAVLGPWSEPQPDLMLRILPECGGQTRDVDQIVAGAPELLTEISHTSRYIDLGPKLRDYERAGVREYVVRALEPDAVYWFVLRDGRFEEVAPGPDGIYRSEVFPGLWLDPEALLRGDTRRLRAVVALGCARPDHAAFVARLEAARRQAQGQPPA